MEHCYAYEYNLIDLLIPSVSVYHTLCYSVDKTQLFLVSLLRCIISLILFKYSFDYFGFTGGYRYLTIVLVTLSLINLVYITLVIIKRPKFQKLK